MAEKDALLEGYEAQIGKEILPQPCRWEAEKGAMQKVVWAAGDLNPLWWEEIYARRTRYGGIMASPMFREWFVLRGAWVAQKDFVLNPRWVVWVADAVPGVRTVAGGKDCEYFRPIKPGDIISLSHKLKSVKKRWSKSLNTNVYILDDELILKNQFDEVVAIHRNTSIRVQPKQSFGGWTHGAQTDSLERRKGRAGDS